MQEKENRKTLIYVVVAAMAVLVAWEPWRQVSSGNNVPDSVGRKLFDDFKDPLAAKSLEVVKYDEDTATIRPFKVAQINGVWSIPSHSNYPADAKEHMAQAATALLDLEVLGVASSSPGDQELYGVIAPEVQKLKPGAVGVGTRVTLKDAKDNTLADLVIGKEVKDQPALRYVRKADRDQIYRVSIKTDKLSTKFEDWIEKDLLKLNAFDVREVELSDYSSQTGVTPDGRRGLALDMRSRAKLGFDDGKSSWNVIEIEEADQNGKLAPTHLAEDEELNNEKLNNLKTALDDLQIVDVERKPTGLSQDLRASDEFVKNVEAVQSLRERGFYPASRAGGALEIYSSEGEAACTTKDGVRYVLRFGQLAGGSESKDEKKADGKAASNPALNRYLFLMAQFDKNQIPQPQFEPVPGEDKPAEVADTPDKPDAENATEEKPGDELPAAEKSTQEKPSNKPVPEKKTAAQDEAAETAAAKDGDKDDAKPAKTEAAGTAEPKTEKVAGDEPNKDASAAATDEQKIAAQKENKRKQDEYNDAVKKGEDRVKELNDRFADWYFIISDDVYKKIHLSRADIVKKKEAKDAKDAPEKTGAPLDLKQFEQGLGAPK